MECHCFNKIVCAVFPNCSEISYIEKERAVCAALINEINRHKILKTALEINKSDFSHSNYTEIKIKDQAYFNCIDKKFKAQVLYQLLSRHFDTLTILQMQVSKTKQHQFIVCIDNTFKHVLGNTNTVSNYLNHLKNHVAERLNDLKNYLKNNYFYSTKELKSEIEKHQRSLNILQLFYSFKDYYSLDFDSSIDQDSESSDSENE